MIYAQNSSRSATEHYYWVDFGIGGSGVDGEFGTHGQKSGLSIEFSLYYQVRKHLFSFRFVKTISSDFSLIGPGNPSESISEVGVLYGRVAKASYGAASVSGGISVVTDDFSYSKSFTTVGIPFEAQLIWTPTTLFGIGFKAFANVNSQKSFLGGLLCFQIGKL